jgi:hypothetical protein
VAATSATGSPSPNGRTRVTFSSASWRITTRNCFARGALLQTSESIGRAAEVPIGSGFYSSLTERVV